MLVHISTPATRHNDDLYRSVADAYKKFEPYRRHGDGFDLDEAFQATGTQTQHDISILNVDTTPAKGDSNHPGANGSMFSTSKDSYGSFPSYISSEDQECLDSQLGYDDGSAPTSSRLAKLNRIHVNWKNQTTPRANISDRQRQTSRTEEEEDEADTAFIENSQLAAQVLQSQLRDNYSTTDEDTEEDDESEMEGDGEAGQVKVYASCLESRRQNLSSNAVEVLPSTHLAETGDVGAGDEKIRLLDTTLDFSLSTTQDADETQMSVETNTAALHVSDFTKLPVDAFPPAPEVGVARPGTLPSQITRHLAAIKVQNPTRFRPCKKLRALESDERGCWTVNCSSWPQTLQHEFWVSLCEHVWSGRLGWATTLHRDFKCPERIGNVKVYCWGEVVEHLWLLLWVCSKGRVSGSGSKWSDADGIAVIEMV